MKFLIFIFCFFLFVNFAYAQVGYNNPNLPLIVKDELTAVATIGNASWNQSLADLSYLRLDKGNWFTDEWFTYDTSAYNLTFNESKVLHSNENINFGNYSITDLLNLSITEGIYIKDSNSKGFARLYVYDASGTASIIVGTDSLVPRIETTGIKNLTITSNSGDISFANENLWTTGTICAGAGCVGDTAMDYTNIVMKNQSNVVTSGFNLTDPTESVEVYFENGYLVVAG